MNKTKKINKQAFYNIFTKNLIIKQLNFCKIYINQKNSLSFISTFIY